MMNAEPNVSIHDVEFVCMDFETTGLDHQADKVIEVAAVRFTTSEEKRTYQSFVNIEESIPQQAMEIHNIDSDMLADAPDIKRVLQDMLELIEGAVLVAHNIMFDFRFLNAELVRNGFSAIESAQLVDTITVSRKVIQELSSYSLESVAKHFNIAHTQQHRALNDALVCKAILLRCIHEMSILGELSLSELLI